MAPIAFQHLAVCAGDGEVQARELRVARKCGFHFGDAIGTGKFDVVIEGNYDWSTGCAQPDVSAFASGVGWRGDVAHIWIFGRQKALQFRFSGVVDHDDLGDLVRVGKRRCQRAPEMLMALVGENRDGDRAAHAAANLKGRSHAPSVARVSSRRRSDASCASTASARQSSATISVPRPPSDPISSQKKSITHPVPYISVASEPTRAAANIARDPN